jgi:transposase
MDGACEHECPNCRRLQARVDELERRVAQLEALLEQALRAGKRQAAPFSKRAPKKVPKKPGRKPGDGYGKHHRRAIPDRVDETYDVPLPARCPHCRGRSLAEEHVYQQYQSEIPRRPVVRQFDVHVGTCGECGRRVQGRHRLQTSDALGAAAVQLGGDAHAALAILNKEFGLSHGKCAALFERLFGLAINRSSSVRSVLKTAHRAEPAGEEIRTSVRGSPQLTCDETGWRIGGHKAWLHVAVGERASWYEVARTRDHTVLEGLIGPDYAGTLIHDGWAVYDRFTEANHQQCVAHILRRARDLAASATRCAAQFPRQIVDLFGRALAVRDRFRSGQIGEQTMARRGLDLMEQLQHLTAHPKRNAANDRLRRHLSAHLGEWFLFLFDPRVEATSNRAERAIRPAVVNRKVWGGNRTDAGAHAQSILMSVITTCHRTTIDVLDFLSNTRRSTTPLTLLT